MATVDLLRALEKDDKLGLRLWVMLRDANAKLATDLRRYYIIGDANGHFTVRAIKRQMDGALGSHGAWLLAPYSDLPADAPNRSGINTEDLTDIRSDG